MAAFRNLDAARVQRIFDQHVPPPFRAAVTLTHGDTVMSVQVMDPDDAAMPVAACRFDHERRRANTPRASLAQPDQAEIVRIAAEFATLCAAYPAAKAEAIARRQAQA